MLSSSHTTHHFGTYEKKTSKITTFQWTYGWIIYFFYRVLLSISIFGICLSDHLHFDFNSNRLINFCMFCTIDSSGLSPADWRLKLHANILIYRNCFGVLTFFFRTHSFYIYKNLYCDEHRPKFRKSIYTIFDPSVCNVAIAASWQKKREQKKTSLICKVKWFPLKKCLACGIWSSKIGILILKIDVEFCRSLCNMSACGNGAWNMFDLEMFENDNV